MKASHRREYSIVASILLGLVCVPRSPGEPLLRPGERMVFLGDSITEQRCYTRYVMNYFTLRYPGSDISFRNAGWSGDTAAGGLNRLQRDVLNLKPQVVSICFGMNDGGYGGFNQNAYDRYTNGMIGLVTQLTNASIRVILLTPGCIDPDKRLNGLLYNDTLKRFAGGVKEIAAQRGLPVSDLYSLMLDVQTRAKADDPQFTMIPDSVHPSPPGQAVMAYGLLKALGCTDRASGLTIDAAAGKATPDRCKVTDLKSTPDALSFVRTDEALPTFLDAAAAPVLKYIPFEQDMNPYSFKVTGLKPGNWQLVVQGVTIGTNTAEELAQGVNLASMPGPWQALGDTVNGLSIEQENLYFMAWRQVHLMAVPPEAQPEQQALAKKLNEIVAARELLRIKAPTGDRAWTWSLTFVVPEPPAIL